MPNTDPDRRIRPFADTLLELFDGASHDELSEALNELLQAVALTGKSGTLTYTLKVRPAGRNATGTVMFTDNVATKMPKVERQETVFFVDGDGNPSRHAPNQERLPLREVPGAVIIDPDFIADPTTGELQDHA